MKHEPAQIEDGPIVIEDGSFDDWFTIVSAGKERFLGRINSADIEGTHVEMLAIADAIAHLDWFSERRCAVDARDVHGDRVLLWSPRNSMRATSVTRIHAQALAIQIREKFAVPSLPTRATDSASPSPNAIHPDVEEALRRIREAEAHALARLSEAVRKAAEAPSPARSDDHPHCATCVCGRRAPVQADRTHGPGTIAWAEHEQAWSAYAARYPGQSAERIAERGGFSYGELQEYLGRDPLTWSGRGARS